LTTFPTGGWHLLTVHLTLGTSGHVDVWLDGVKDTTLSKNDNFGTTPIGKLQLGENGSGRNFEVRYDDITVSASALTP
jgi:large repetitive protein